MLPHIPQVFEIIHIKSWKDLPHLLVVISLTFGIGIGVYLALQPQIFKKQASSDSIVDLRFIPESIKVEIGREYEAKIAINPKRQEVNAVSLQLSYNPDAISVVEVKNGGFLPIDLRINDDQIGNLSLIYGSTIESQANQPGMLSVIKFKSLDPSSSKLQIKSTSEVSVSSKEGNMLKVFPALSIEPVGLVSQPGEEVKYPDNLLLEKAFFASSEPVVRDFRESLEPKPEITPVRVKPEFSAAFILQLGRDIFISPIAALNEVLEEKVGEILGK